MSPLFGLLVLLTMPSSLCVISALGDVNFQPYECYRDLCVSRRQFCSAKEERCKTCQPAHCQDISAAPEACRPVCLELLESHSTRSSSTTAAATAVTTAQILQAETNAPPGGRAEDTLLSTRPEEEKGVVSLWMILVGSMALVLLLVVVILILVVVTLNNTFNLRGRLPPGKKRRGLGVVEEGRDLLGQGGGQWGSKCSNKTEGAASQVTELSFSLPPKTDSTSPLLGSYARTGQDSKSVQTDPSPVPHVSPPYTARTASQLLLCETKDAVIQTPTDGQGEDSLRHLKNHDYRLLPASDKKLEAGHDLPTPHSPRFPYTASTSLHHVGMAGPDLATVVPSGVEETYPKSL